MLKGMEYLSRGFKLIKAPGMKRYVIVPLTINIIVFLGFIACAYHFTMIANSWLSAHLPSWLHWLDWILWALFLAGILFFFAYVFTAIANIIAAPFNGFLSEKVEQHITGKVSKDTLSFKDLCLLIPRTLIRQFQLLFYFLPRAIILFILFFIPGVNVVAGVLWFFFSSWMMTIQYLDYPYDNHQVPFKKMIADMKDKRWLHMNFGMYVTVLSIIPIVNLFVIPAAVAGVTALWAEEHREKYLDK